MNNEITYRSKSNHGVIAAGVERVTTKEPAQPEPDPFPDTVALYRLQGVGRAAREKAAGARQERR